MLLLFQVSGISYRLISVLHFALANINRIGVEEASKLLDKTLLLEESGGMPTASGDRRRTPGVPIYIHNINICTYYRYVG